MIWKHVEKPEKEWERWFAWHPVPIGQFPVQDGQTMVWLQWIERKWLECRGSNSYEYRLPCDQ